jgi:tripartite-type tricarboxylate transporter receptor subunit TctC
LKHDESQAVLLTRNFVAHVFASDRSKIAGAFLGALIVVSVAAGHAAEHAPGTQAAYPVKPVRLIVAQATGGNSDFVARIYAQRLGERFGQQVVVDNRPGAGGVIATELVVNALPDGYTILLAPTSHSTNPTLIKKLPYDTRRDLKSVSLLALGPNLLVVNSALPARTVKELIAIARAQPGKLNFASSGIASAPHLAGEYFKHLAGINIQHVAYKGASAAMVAISTGESDMSFASMPSALPLVRAGKLRMIAVTGAARWPALPEVPTVAESGVPGFETSNWQGLFAPAKTSIEIINRLQREIAAVAKMPDVRERMMADGLEPQGTTPKELDEHVAREMAKWAKVAKAAALVAN